MGRGEGKVRMSGGGMGYRVGGGFNILDLLCKDGAGSFFISSILKWREMSDWGGRGGAVRRGDWGGMGHARR